LDRIATFLVHLKNLHWEMDYAAAAGAASVAFF